MIEQKHACTQLDLLVDKRTSYLARGLFNISEMIATEAIVEDQ
jgi:hypothetical protein